MSSDPRPHFQLPPGWQCTANSHSGSPVFRKVFRLRTKRGGEATLRVTVAQVWGAWIYHADTNSWLRTRAPKAVGAVADSPRFTEPEGAIVAVELKLAELNE